MRGTKPILLKQDKNRAAYGPPRLAGNPSGARVVSQFEFPQWGDGVEKVGDERGEASFENSVLFGGLPSMALRILATAQHCQQSQKRSI
jgi:hypothetical protein